MEHEATMQFLTNLDRTAIESKLSEAKALAESKNFSDVVSLLVDVEGKSREELDARIRQCLGLVAGSPDGKRLSALLEMIQVNLANLK